MFSVQLLCFTVLGSISLNLPSDVQQGIEVGADCVEPRILAAIPLQCPPLMQVFGSGEWSIVVIALLGA